MEKKHVPLNPTKLPAEAGSPAVRAHGFGVGDFRGDAARRVRVTFRILGNRGLLVGLPWLRLSGLPRGFRGRARVDAAAGEPAPKAAAGRRLGARRGGA